MVFTDLEQFISTTDIATIGSERKAILQPLIDYLQSKIDRQSKICLNFICTHNSRRSHLSQIWAQTMAYYFGFNQVTCYSAGTEQTALFPMIATTLSKSGFQISKLAETQNPVYNIKYAENEHPIIGFSKELDHPFNPKSEFAAILTCSQADQGCPMVHGAEIRIPVTFEDPKAFDGTELQAEKYLERSVQIATELFFVFSQLKH